MLYSFHLTWKLSWCEIINITMKEWKLIIVAWKVKINHANHELYYQQKILSSIIGELGTSIYKKRSSWRNVMPKFFTVDYSVIRNLFLRWTRQIYCGTKWSRFNGCSRMTPVPMNENTDVLNSRFTDHQIDHITRITRDILLLCLHICYFHEKRNNGKWGVFWRIRANMWLSACAYWSRKEKY